MRTDNLNKMKNHISNIHRSKKNIFECECCQKISYHVQQIKDHLYRKHNIYHQCEQCYLFFETDNVLTEHIINKHNPKYKNKCIICKKTFWCLSILNTHKKRAHATNEVIHDHVPATNRKGLKTLKPQTLTSPATVIHNKHHTCPFRKCHISTINLKKLKTHIANSHQSHSKFFACIYCPFTCMASKAFKDHLFYIHDKTFTCKQCQWTFINDDNLIEHQKKLHNSNHKFKCTICNQTYRFSSSFDSHTTTAHSKNIDLTTIKQEINPNPHTWSNKAPIWQNDYSGIEDEYLISTNFKGIRRPIKTKKPNNKIKGNLKKQIDSYISLSSDEIEQHLNRYMKDIVCDGDEESALKGRNGVIATCDIHKWTILGHYAGRLMLESESDKTLPQDTYAVGITPQWFISGYCYGNVTSLINANTDYQRKRPYPPHNVSFLTHNHINGYVVFVLSTNEIKQGHSILLDYGKSYWVMQREPTIIDSD